ncbi:MAG: isopenicillin N synthase family dioxygenase [Myxococcota bacterium]
MPAAEFSHIPCVDVAELVGGGPGRFGVAARLGEACRESGFFYVVGHGVDDGLQRELRELSRRFFAQDPDTKLRIRMELGGRAWRGYFPVGAELTSGKPDQKEGIYFGAELPADDPRVRAGTPLHGPNLFPAEPAGLRAAVLSYMAAMTRLGHRLVAGLALALDLPETYFAERYTREPLTLFRIFNYPAARDPTLWGVGEHTDYGLLTMLLQDDAGGLEVRSRSRWVAAPPILGSFVCNIGDMLDRMTRGVFRSTPHRARNAAPRDRLSFPFFFDPGWSARVRPIDLPADAIPADDRAERWDRASVHAFDGTYGDYLLGKVEKVFPGLRAAVL